MDKGKGCVATVLIQKGTLKSDIETASTFLANRIANPSQDATKAAYENALYVTYQTKLKNKKISKSSRYCI